MSKPNGSQSGGELSRREFARGAAMAVATLASSGLLAAETAAAAAKPQNPAASESPVQEEIDAKLANIVRKWGDRLNDQQRQRLRRVLGENERMLAAVRAFPLENGDPPSQVLKLTDDEYEPRGGTTPGNGAS
ncbi:MAG TPA: hypothetical protein VN661_13000 [Candidatus Acidoferrales bacterium]|nr:hypothetical protein [Candidatus Acidoferrales bacterium]